MAAQENRAPHTPQGVWTRRTSSALESNTVVNVGEGSPVDTGAQAHLRRLATVGTAHAAAHTVPPSSDYTAQVLSPTRTPQPGKVESDKPSLPERRKRAAL